MNPSSPPLMLPIIVVAVDVYQEATLLVRQAITIGRRMGGAHVTLAHAVAPMRFIPTGESGLSFVDEELREAQERLYELGEAIVPPEIYLHVQVMVGSPVDAISEACASLGSSLLIVGTPRPRLRILRSVSEGLVRRAPCSVLAISPRAAVDAVALGNANEHRHGVVEAYPW